ncbi:P-loop containing nucleoside triphosphate hydrolase protein [Polyporus arcularius HHB13444]|uniref:P-loop containing nucleoside triphosphate hydrolase protein n=1 Tax=Polyporus arcularius HHB13444 TaxID=1314778 RepID=A0A5C3NZX5_9APHY|nr:P-loop containing nucleoside triphosphate hydrolase protein [Polyporus arcularius HHB13444]
MRRPTSLVVDIDTTSTTSMTDASTLHLPQSATSLTAPAESTAPTSQCTPPQASISLLFSLLSRREFFVLVLPAILTSLFAGGVAPFMTYVIGRSFDSFAAFPTGPNPSEDAKHALLRGVGLAALELVGLAVGALALSSVTSSLWIWTGERNLVAVRKQIYSAVTRKDMVWFDTKMGSEDSVQAVEGDGPIGAGGLMANFARETDEVRAASSLAAGMVVQYTTTFLTSLVLAFVWSWSLTLVILSAVPLLMIIQTLSQGFVGPRLAAERAHSASAATLVDRAVAAIATVKAFNAETHEEEQLGTTLEKIRRAAIKCHAVWGVSTAASQFVMMAMFVQAFWFGSKLVRDGTISPGIVMSVFWACLIATSNLQMCIPQLIVLTKGKFAMVSLMTLAQSRSDVTPYGGVLLSPTKSHRRPSIFRRIRPAHCRGHFELSDVSFAYPSRPTLPVLQDISIFLPPQEMSFIVGGSGSGKSTLAQLLLRMYNPTSGSIFLDDQELGFLDEDFTRANIAAVSQNCILFDMSVHDNVAMGVAGHGSSRKPSDVTREEVMRVCRAALMHEFVRDLPDGYDTQLGNSGANLSGGQKQRLAIARALLRNPTVLILDEATSALDATSRILVFEAIKRWRRNMTTIVITHDLSQVSSDDFVHVLKDGRLVEQGFRHELESFDSEFSHMACTQDATGGFKEKDVEDEAEELPIEAILDQQDEEKQEELEAVTMSTRALRHHSIAPSTFRPLTLGNWMFDAIAELTKNGPAPAVAATRESRPLSRFVPADTIAGITSTSEAAGGKKFRRRTLHIAVPEVEVPAPLPTASSNRFSLQFTPTSPTLCSTPRSFAQSMVEDDEAFEKDKAAMQRSAARASERRHHEQRRNFTRDVHLDAVIVEKVEDVPEETSVQKEADISFWQLIRDIYPTLPNKPLILLGMVICVLSGTITPLFSYLLSRLFFEVSNGARNVSIINIYGGIVLAVAAADGLFIGLKIFIMENAAMDWVTHIREACFKRVLGQDKKWFDKTENAPVRLVQILIKDGDDARALIASVLCQTLVVSAMLGVGLIWALARGWQLTLVGFAIAPVFAGVMALQSNLVSKCEVRNKRAREEVAKQYYDAISNVRAIRAMGFEDAFQEKFDIAVDSALTTGVRGAFVEGCTYGVASALIYLAEALLFYVGAVLIAKGTYSYLQMIQTLQLVVFSVSIGSQLMAFTHRIAKATRATRDFNRLLKLSTATDESKGILTPDLSGPVSFTNVTFSYPERPDVPVLRNLFVEVRENECVAIVGSSGSGKSTMAALLQRLYEPDTGCVAIGPHVLRSTDVHYLRDHVSVVSQQPNLFDASIAENIRYGNKSLSMEDIRRAAKAANVHEFVESLPKGYDTPVGENASLISGGQAQRLQIARALARPARILILDECTSALDAANQAAVMETLQEAKVGRTTLVVTHKLAMMRMCDRILVVHEGVIAEQGTYEDLMQKRGVFAQLASGGEWMSD